MKKNDQVTTFEEIYLAYFSKMKHFAKVYVLSEEEAENIVQDIFTELWEKRDVRLEYTNLAAYLFVSTKNKCLNYLRHQAMRQESADKIQEEYRLTLQTGINSLEVLDLDFLSDPNNVKEKLNAALDLLPERCRQIFVMSKIKNKKQKEIAEELQISIHTVETQMGIAYLHLRKELKRYFTLILVICFY
ncbi:MAG: RNA polymerase sigma-70 factor [Tannerellaceae bacterium]|nr:RNA polymerase sigma-70 factor [Tannerellaceae bacterium]